MRKLPWAVDQDAMARGFLVVHSEVKFRGGQVPIRIEYPSETPELPPTVFSDPPILERHQQPFRGNFCLLARPEDDWKAQEWGAADLIAERLVALLRDTEAGPDVVRANEAPMPEPRGAMYQYEGGSVVLVPGNLASPSGDGGRLRLNQFDQNRFVVASLGREAGDARLTEAYGARRGQVSGMWRRLKRAPADGPDGSAVLAWLKREHRGFVRFPPPPPPRKRGRRAAPRYESKVFGLVFPEEADPEGNTRDGWLFLVAESPTQGTLLHAQIASEEERVRRIPELRDLPGRKVVVVGGGSLGGEAAVSLARAGVGRLHLIDFDRFEANNSVRHILGAVDAGRNKALAISDACSRANPFCEVSANPHLHFGDVYPPEAGDLPAPLEQLHQAVADADLVLETTGVHQLQLLVSRVCWELGKPVVLSWLTDGSWAGEVACLVPGITACAVCFSRGQSEKTVLIGEADPDAAVFAQGCTHPTTSGAGFEASEVVANAVRVVAGTLADGYAKPGWDHAVFNFRRLPEDTDHPRFAVETLLPNPDCALCRRDAG